VAEEASKARKSLANIVKKAIGQQIVFFVVFDRKQQNNIYSIEKNRSAYIPSYLGSEARQN